MAFSPDGKLLASAGVVTMGQQGRVQLWDVAGAKEQAAFGYYAQVYSAAFRPDGKLLALGTGHGRFQVYGRLVGLWDVATATHKVTFRGHNTSSSVRAVAFSPDGKLLASGSKEIILWNVADAKAATTTRQEGEVRSVAFNPDGRLLASAGKDLRLWDVAAAK